MFTLQSSYQWSNSILHDSIIGNNDIFLKKCCKNINFTHFVAMIIKTKEIPYLIMLRYGEERSMNYE